MSLLIYAKQITPRLNYIAKLLFQERMGLTYKLSDNSALFQQSINPKINYSNQSFNQNHFSIPVCGLLFEKNIQPQAVDVQQLNGLPYFFAQNTANASLPFDLFALAFYLLTRYEEHLPFQVDEHGRFSMKNSLAYQKQFLQQPLVDQWIQRLSQLLQQQFPSLEIKQSKYIFQPTFDIDDAWAFLQRPWWHLGGGILKDVLLKRYKSLRIRLNVLQGKQEDPYNIFDYLKQLHADLENQPIFFFLMGNRSKYDRNINSKRKAFQELIAQLHTSYAVGIHPSYASNKNAKLLGQEKGRLEAIINQGITKSRQHFLKLHLPYTYQQLIKIGIKDDYSMGYAGAIGFRASTCFPYTWYDLQNEETTSLTIHPFQVMDVTLKRYLHLKPEACLAEIRPIIQHIRSVGGTFCSLWHNSSFSEIDHWENWKEVYEELVQVANSFF